MGVLLLAATALVLCLHANRFGADVLPDSGDYITAGVRLARGEGYSIPNRQGPPVPLIWFPPLFSTVIAAMEHFHWPMYRAVGIFNAGCYALLVGMAGVWVWQGSRSGFWSSLAALMVLSSHAVYLVHSIVLSEPLFLIFVTAALWSISAWRAGGKLRFAVLTGVFISMAMLTRYAGLSLIPACLLIALLSPGVKWRQRGAAVALMALIGLSPSFFWSRYHTPPNQSATGRTIEWHPITRDCIQDGIDTFGSFVLPDDYSLHLSSKVLLGIGLLLIAGSVFFGMLSNRTRFSDADATVANGKSAIFVSLVFVLVYVAFLIASISLIDADTPLDERILSVLVTPLAVIVCLGMRALLIAIRSLPIRLAVGALAVFVLLAHSASIRDELRQRQSPEDLAWFPTLQSDTLDSLRDIPATEAVWSDKPCAIYMAYRLRTDALPERPKDPDADDQSREDYDEAIQTLRDNLTDAGGGWVLLWHQLPDFGDGFLTEQDVRNNFVIAEEDKFEDGILLRINDPEAKRPAATEPLAK